MITRLLIGNLFGASLSLACMCVDPMPTAEMAFGKLAAVFVGVVQEDFLDRAFVRIARLNAGWVIGGSISRSKSHFAG